MKKWQCTVCGYVHEGEEPPDECPICGADKSQFVLLQETPTGTKPEKATVVKDSDPKIGPILKWRCSVCGYVHEGIEPPDICPVCGADKSQFDLVEENGKVEEKTAASQPQGDTQTSAQAAKDSHPGAFPFSSARFEPISQFLTRFHGHPIAVHIPNGVLPVAFIFTLIALLFNSPGFAIAAKYNIILVALAMPLVITTGLIDWNNRYKRRMTNVFMVKMICAGIVTLFSILIGIWWIIRPEIHTAGFSASGLFLFINVVNLGAAIVAGWYGGKLVFKK